MGAHPGKFVATLLLIYSHDFSSSFPCFRLSCSLVGAPANSFVDAAAEVAVTRDAAVRPAGTHFCLPGPQPESKPKPASLPFGIAFDTQDLPTTKEPNRTLIGSSGKAAKFFLVLPFVARLKKWIKQNRKQQQTQQLTKEVHLQQQQEAHQTQPVQILRPPMSLEDVELAMMRDASRQAAPAQQQGASLAGREVGGARPPPSSSLSPPTSTSTPTFRFRRDLVMAAFDGAVVAAAAPSRNAIAVNLQPR